MKHCDNWLRSVGADSFKESIKTVATAPELPKRIVDSGRPVHARDDLRGWSSSTGSKTLSMDSESKFDHTRSAVRLAHFALGRECPSVTSGRLHHAGQTIL